MTDKHYRSNKEQMFVEVARECGVSSAEYERIAYRNTLAIQQRRDDEAGGKTAPVIINYGASVVPQAGP